MKTRKFDLDNSIVIHLVIWLITVVVFFVMNWLEPYCLDDFSYNVNLATGSSLDSVADIVEGQIWHYYEGNGRIIAHTIDQLFFLLESKMYFNIANTIVAVSLLYLVYRLTQGNRINNVFLLLEVSLAILCSPGVGQVYLWQTGACNYLWGSAILILFFSFYLRKLFAEDEGTIRPMTVGQKTILTVVMALLGVIAGDTIEAGASMVLFGIVCIIALEIYMYRVQHKDYWKPYVWEYVGLISMMAGLAALLLSPGQRRRKLEVEAMVLRDNVLVEYAYRLVRETYYFVLICAPLILLIGCLFLSMKRDKIKDQRISAILCTIISLVGVYVMTLSVGYATRVLLTPMIIGLILLGILVRHGIRQESKPIWGCVAIGFAVFTSLQIATGLLSMYRTGEYLNIAFSYIGESKLPF